MELVFATNNAHKIKEVAPLLKNSIKIVSLKDKEIKVHIPETKDTIEGNASEKAFFIYDKFKFNCFADDTALEIEALNGEPGVYSARYAGPRCNFRDNVDLVLENMEGKTNRRAKFRTVISLVIDGKETKFEGFVKGIITTEPYGKDGFGYDPIFIPDGHGLSFAEMTLEEKNKISHRGKATAKLVDYINKNLK